MPIYEYECEECGHKFEELQKVGARKLKLCLKCGRHKLRRVIDAPNVHFKGPGWTPQFGGMVNGGKDDESKYVKKAK
jgi:putative FmdB family regulatory protein